MVKVSWVVDVELITDWLAGLDDRSHELVIAALELLAERGPLLGRPLVDTVTSSRHNNMKELRPGSAGRTELRALFAFDPQTSSDHARRRRQARPMETLVRPKYPHRRRPVRPTPQQTETNQAAERTQTPMTTLDDWLKKRPVNRDAVDAHKARMRGELRAYALRELREAQGLTQTQLAGLLHISQNRVSALERGEVEHTQVDTLRRYVDALGGQLRIEVDLGDERIQIA
jgi:predicted XRE-type DNA-binding protein